MKRIEEKVLKFIDEKNLVSRNDKILIALSGGPDSVFLIHFLHKYLKRLKITLGVVHINHRLRGKEADKDEKFCRALTRQLNIDFFSVRKDAAAFASKFRISVEEAGRLIRYKELERIAWKFRYNKIATAHTCDDNAETVLLNLIKGTGLSGISGIPIKRGNIIRPLLVLTKNEILHYLQSLKIDYRTDLTNFEDDYERNFIRNNIIPLIQKRLNPAFANSIFKSTEVFRELNSFIKKKIERLYNELIEKESGEISVSIKKLNLIEKELWGEIFRSVLEKEFNYQLSFDEFKKIQSLILKQTGKRISLANSLVVHKERDKIVFNIYGKPEFESLSLKPGNSVRIDDKTISIRKIRNRETSNQNRNIEFINADKIKNDFVLRRWKYGDRFFPFGMKGSKKLSDFLNEQKLPSFRKSEQLVLTNDDKIVWVVGLRLDDRFKVLPGTKKIYKLWMA